MTKRITAMLLSALTLTISLSGCSILDTTLEQQDGPSSPADPVPSDDGEDDYYTIVSAAQIEHEGEPGQDPVYGGLDEHDRPTYVYTMLTETVESDAESRADTPGMEHNAETDIPAIDVEGSQPYHGWFYNRSHLLADSLGGSEELENMVTGTRTQNVGSTQVDGQYAGGMAYAEKTARDYLNSHDGDTCPLYYAVEPNFTDDELIPRTVTIDMRSCDSAIDQRIVVTNQAAGHEIDYHTGEWRTTS